MRLLVTGGSGKVGQAFLHAFLAYSRFADWDVVALSNRRSVDISARIRVVQGSMSDPAIVADAMDGVTHVVHMAAVKETPELIFDVALKGLYLLLEAFRGSKSARQFVHLSGDCTVGHMFQHYDAPVTELSARKAYPGCYPLTKTLEEVMLEQFGIQYGINWTALRAPWIMEKDDFRFAFAFGDDQFGGPKWADIMDEEQLQLCRSGRYVPVMRDVTGHYLKRNFIHVDDLVTAILATVDNPRVEAQLLNVSMDQPVDYGVLGQLLSARYGLKAMEINTPFYSNWLDNSKARMVLGWSPKIDLGQMIDRAWQYTRADNDPRIVWYPG